MDCGASSEGIAMMNTESGVRRVGYGQDVPEGV